MGVEEGKEEEIKRNYNSFGLNSSQNLVEFNQSLKRGCKERKERKKRGEKREVSFSEEKEKK